MDADEVKRRRSSIIKPLLTRKQWDDMLAAWRACPSDSYVANATGIGKATVKRAITLGFPEFGWPPFVEVVNSPSTAHKELAVLQENWTDAIAAKTESARQAAQEAMAARIGMASAMKCAQMTHTFVEKVLAKMDADDFEVPEELTPKVIFQLAKALETTNNVLAKAMEIQNKRIGSPENTLGTVVVDLLERCSDDELEQVVAKGELPARITGHKRVVDADSEPLPTGTVPAPPYVGPTDPATVQQILEEAKKTAQVELHDALNVPEIPDPEIACIIDFSDDDSDDSDQTDQNTDADVLPEFK
jgi:hypothetical protein